MQSKQTCGGLTANCRDNTNWFDPSLLLGKEICTTVGHRHTHTGKICKHTGPGGAVKLFSSTFMQTRDEVSLTLVGFYCRKEQTIVIYSPFYSVGINFKNDCNKWKQRVSCARDTESAFKCTKHYVYTFVIFTLCVCECTIVWGGNLFPVWDTPATVSFTQYFCLFVCVSAYTNKKIE